MSKALPFPFETLPQYTQEEAQLKKKLLNAYYFFETRSEVLNDIVKPLKEIIKSDLKLSVTHVESTKLDNFISSLPEKTLLGLVRVEPYGKKAVVLFETLLAKLLVFKTLSGDAISQTMLSQLQLKSITPLEEAVVQYILVSIIERLSSNINPKNFSISYEDVLRDSKKLVGHFSNQDNFAAFSLHLQLFDRDFYLKLLLPIDIADNLGMTQIDEQFFKERLRQFQMFQIPMQLEVANVTLSANEVDELGDGDIILFDEVQVELDDGRIKGHAKIKPEDHGSHDGYLVHLETEGSTVSARVESAL